MLGSIRFYSRPSSKMLLYPPSAQKVGWLEVQCNTSKRTSHGAVWQRNGMCDAGCAGDK